jgi:hypothetical protein
MEGPPHTPAPDTADASLKAAFISFRAMAAAAEAVIFFSSVCGAADAAAAAADAGAGSRRPPPPSPCPGARPDPLAALGPLRRLCRARGLLVRVRRGLELD